VSLIEVAEVGGDGGTVCGTGVQHPQRRLQPSHPLIGLRRQPDLGAKCRRELPWRESGHCLRFRDAHRRVVCDGVEYGPHPAVRIAIVRLQPLQQECFEKRNPIRRRRRCDEPFVQ